VGNCPLKHLSAQKMKHMIEMKNGPGARICGARATADAASDRVFEQHFVRPLRALRGRIPAGPEALIADLLVDDLCRCADQSMQILLRK
jgi:hypothetical protein